jgi:hypothetical protein
MIVGFQIIVIRERTFFSCDVLTGSGRISDNFTEMVKQIWLLPGTNSLVQTTGAPLAATAERAQPF